MAREPLLPEIEDEEADDELKKVYAMCREAMGGVPHLARIIANSKELLEPFLGLAGAIAQEYKVPLAIKQLAVLRTSELNGCSYCRSIQRPKGEQIGIDKDKLDAIERKDMGHELFSDDEKLALRMAEEMTGSIGASAHTVSEAQKRWGEDGAVDLMMTIPFYNLMNRLGETTQAPLEG